MNKQTGAQRALVTTNEGHYIALALLVGVKGGAIIHTAAVSIGSLIALWHLVATLT